MVDKIYNLKNKFIERIESDISNRGIERIDVKEMGELVDMVKDLAEAEEKCWKAQYYRHVVSEAMESKYGYPMNDRQMQDRQGYGMNAMRSGYQSKQNEQDNLIEQLGNEYRNLSHDEKMMMKSKILTKLGSI